MGGKDVLIVNQLCVDGGHALFQRRKVDHPLILWDAGLLRPLPGLRHGELRRAPLAGGEVIVLGVRQPLAVELGAVAAGGAGEPGHSRDRVRVVVAEGHGLYDGRRTASIRASVPGRCALSALLAGRWWLQDHVKRLRELQAWILRKIISDLTLVQGLVLFNQAFEVVGRHVAIFVLASKHALPVQSLFLHEQGILEGSHVQFLDKPREVEDQAPVRVPDEAWVVTGCPRLDDGISQTDVGQVFAPRQVVLVLPDGQQQRHYQAPEVPAGRLLQLGDGLLDHVVVPPGVARAGARGGAAGSAVRGHIAGGHAESRNDRQAQVGHLTKQCTGVPEDAAHTAVPLRLSTGEGTHAAFPSPHNRVLACVVLILIRGLARVRLENLLTR
mmetsp:Transcript_150576/g.484177  ORF Transcript_150576/g.484177 Transcript_150576/m.484177 type:complete len:385 (-) Transcript_150576:851-2005(-)